MRLEAETMEAEQLPMPATPLGRAEAAADAAAMRKKAVAPGELGPGNNWGQEVHYSEVALPSSFDHKRPPTAEAPLGWLDSGVPYSPYGVRPSGKPRLRPSPSLKGREKHMPGAPGAQSAEPRFAASQQKPPPELANLHAALDASHQREVEIVGEMRKRFPETKVGTPIHPMKLGSGEVVRADPLVGMSTIEWFLVIVTAWLAEKCGDEKLKPKEKALTEAAEKISVASKYYGINTDPKSAATGAAIFALIVVFLPYILHGAGKLFDKLAGDD